MNRERLNSLYGTFFAQGGKVEFDLADIPPECRELAVYAEFWGIGDDWDRDCLVDSASSVVRRDLAVAVLGGDQSVLLSWLGGAASRGPTFTAAYIAYTNLGMAAEYAFVTERKLGWDWKPARYTAPKVG